MASYGPAERHGASGGPMGPSGDGGGLSSGGSSPIANPNKAPLVSTSGIWPSPAGIPSAPLLGTQRNLLHAKKERLCGGTLMPYWAARQIVINPVVDEETGNQKGGRPILEMHCHLSRFLHYGWQFLSRPSNLWLMVVYILSLLVYTSHDQGVGSLPHRVLELMGAPFLLLLSVIAFICRFAQASSRREAIKR